MIYLTEGTNSSYYAGISLLVIAIGILLPLTVKEVLVFSIITFVIYLAACYFNQNTLIDTKIFFNNLYFLSLSSIISVTAVHFGAIRRFNEFCLNIELDRQNRELARLNREKSQFFANVSHELRTPLTLILSPIQDLLQRPSVSIEVKDTLTMVKDNTLRLLKLVNDLLDIVRLEEGKTQLNKTPIELNKLVSGLADSVSHLAHSKDITLSRQLSDKPLVIIADQQALEKIFLNLLVNAIKFTRPNGDITVSSYLDNTHTKAFVEIKDTGIGISTTDLPYIFDRFSQADGSSTRAHQGTGLGLAIVKELTEKLGGHVEASSRLGAGTTMRVIFLPCEEKILISKINNAAEVKPTPLLNIIDKTTHKSQIKTSELAEVINPGFAYSNRQPEQGNTNKPLLLIVDDEPDMQRYLISILEEDYQLLCASTGKQGLDLFTQHQPDLILLDLMLPEIDGLEVCRIIKQNTKQHTKIILLTARADESAKIEALKRGADDFLTKPFSSLEVKTRLNNLYQTTQLQRDLKHRHIELQKTLDELNSTQSQLIQSEKINALGNLSAGLLHEINNPLNYTLTALQIALNDPIIQKDEELLDICEDMKEGMERISSIVGDLRAFAHPSDNEKHTPFSFTAAVDKAIRFTTMEHDNITITLFGCEEAWVIGSETHITQVLINLLSNATNAIQKSQRSDNGVINIKCHKEKTTLHVDVRDNGIGVTPDIISKIFDPFFTTQDVGSGMGLGLSICQTIIKNHGGELSIKSSPNEGSIVSFDLGLVKTKST
ncbi:MAG: ATP-binding protein [Gammaproteobacteria bacterium]|nr:ATP-binding protein [Gammaproteobacteria bacterium]